MLKLKPLNRQVIVITGASSGIGRATALAAASAGARVVLAARGVEALDVVVRQIVAAGGKALAVPTEVSDEAAVQQLAAQALSRFGTIDSWVNNAGVSISGRLEDIPVEDARRLFDVNFWGVVHGSLAALPILKKTGGALINMGSILSEVAAPYMGMYAASKYAILGFTGALRVEMETEDAPVSITLIKPGPVGTPILQHQRNFLERKPSMPPPFYLPEDVAKAVLHAAEHPSRDLAVGGTTKLGSLAARAMPHVSDRLLSVVGRRTFRTDEAPGIESDNLYIPSQHAGLDGDTRGHVPRASLATRARVSPGMTSLLAVVAVTAGLLLKAALSSVRSSAADRSGVNGVKATPAPTQQGQDVTPAQLSSAKLRAE